MSLRASGDINSTPYTVLSHRPLYGRPPDSDIAVLLTGILMLVFMILIIVTSFITIALTYFQVPCLRFVWGPKLVSWSIFRHILQS